MPMLAIETGIEPDSENRLIASAKQAGWDILYVKHIPFSKELTDETYNPFKKTTLDRKDVWFHGSISTAKVAERTTNWKVDTGWSKHRINYVLQTLESMVFQTDWHIKELKDFLTDAEYSFGKEKHLFVRPVSSDKSFSGQVVSLDTLEADLKNLTFYDPPEDIDILIAPAKKILAEARFFISDMKVVTGSYYKNDGKSVRKPANEHITGCAWFMLGFCLGRQYNPSDNWILDLAQDEDDKWWILETGAASCAGLYACDTNAIIQSVGKQFEKE